MCVSNYTSHCKNIRIQINWLIHTNSIIKITSNLERKYLVFRSFPVKDRTPSRFVRRCKHASDCVIFTIRQSMHLHSTVLRFRESSSRMPLEATAPTFPIVGQTRS